MSLNGDNGSDYNDNSEEYGRISIVCFILILSKS